MIRHHDLGNPIEVVQRHQVSDIPRSRAVAGTLNEELVVELAKEVSPKVGVLPQALAAKEDVLLVLVLVAECAPLLEEVDRLLAQVVSLLVTLVLHEDDQGLSAILTLQNELSVCFSSAW